MNCDFKYIEALMNRELGVIERKQVQDHIAQCSICKNYCKEMSGLNDILSTYQSINIDVSLLYNLKQIPYLSKRRFSLFNLLPRELALTAASVMFALFMGAFISTMTITTYQDELTIEQDIFDQISLASLLD